MDLEEQVHEQECLEKNLRYEAANEMQNFEECKEVERQKPNNERRQFYADKFVSKVNNLKKKK